MKKEINLTIGIDEARNIYIDLLNQMTALELSYNNLISGKIDKGLAQDDQTLFVTMYTIKLNMDKLRDAFPGIEEYANQFLNPDESTSGQR